MATHPEAANDSIQGYFRAGPELFDLSSGYSFFLGDNSGLQPSFVDREVENGRRYFYAVVAYDAGDAAYGNIGVFPGENTKSIRFASSGEIESKDINVVTVTPNAKTAGYVRPAEGFPLSHPAGPATGEITYKILDETKLTNRTYKLEFLDTQVDGIDNNGNGLIDGQDSTECARVTTSYSVLDTAFITETFLSKDLPQQPIYVDGQRDHGY